MERFGILVAMLTGVLYLGAVSFFAQHGGGGGRGMGGGMGHGSGDGHGMGSHETSATHGGGKGSMATASGKSVDDLLSRNTRLASKLEGILKLSGPNALTQLQADAAGFKNLGQFVAAVHVSQNLGIPFDQLKAAMVQNGKQTSSLGKAIQSLKPETKSAAETKKATKEANDDLKESEKAA